MTRTESAEPNASAADKAHPTPQPTAASPTSPPTVAPTPRAPAPAKAAPAPALSTAAPAPPPSSPAPTGGSVKRAASKSRSTERRDSGTSTAGLNFTLTKLAESDQHYASLAKWLTKGDAKVFVKGIKRVTHPELWANYKNYRDSVMKGLGREKLDACYVEQWLWHGTSNNNLNSLLNTGWQTTHSRYSRSFYGPGSYFAADPKLSHFYLDNHRSKTLDKTIILARVVTGKMCAKSQICTNNCTVKEWIAKVMDPKNLAPPKGYNSIYNDPMKDKTSGTGTEAIMFGKYFAYPAYLITFNAPEWSSINPYKVRKGYANVFSLDSLSPVSTCPKIASLPGGKNLGNHCPY